MLGVIAASQRECALGGEVLVVDAELVLAQEGAEVEGTAVVGGAQHLPGLPLLEEPVDDISGGEVGEVGVREAHLVAAGVGAHGRPLLGARILPGAPPPGRRPGSCGRRSC